MRRALVAGAVLIVLAGLAWGVWRGQDAPDGPRSEKEERDRLPIGDRPGPRCKDAESDRVLASAAAAVAKGEPDAFGLRRLDDVVVVPRSVLLSDADHGVQFGYEADGASAYGFRLHGVAPGSLGHALGFRKGDVVGEAGREVIGSIEAAKQSLARFQVDGVGCLRVLRDGRWRPRWFVLEERVAAEAP